MPFAREVSDADAASVVRRELGWAESPMPSAADLVGARHWRAVYLGLSWRATLAMQSAWGRVGVRHWQCNPWR